MGNAEPKVAKATNIYQKLQSMRVDLQNRNLKKSGYNEHKKYEYFELGDFLPAINEIQKKYGTITLFDINKECAMLSVLDTDNIESKIEFRIPIAELSIAGANGIQNMGGLTTYCRRYLYMIAFEIAENDEFDPNKDNSEPQPQVNPEQVLVDEIKIKVLKDKMAKKGVKVEQILERYNLNTLEEMTVFDFMRACSGLDKSPDIESKQVDLGL